MAVAVVQHNKGTGRAVEQAYPKRNSKVISAEEAKGVRCIITRGEVGDRVTARSQGQVQQRRAPLNEVREPRGSLQEEVAAAIRAEGEDRAPVAGGGDVSGILIPPEAARDGVLLSNVIRVAKPKAAKPLPKRVTGRRVREVVGRAAGEAGPGIRPERITGVTYKRREVITDVLRGLEKSGARRGAGGGASATPRVGLCRGGSSRSQKGVVEATPIGQDVHSVPTEGRLKGNRSRRGVRGRGAARRGRTAAQLEGRDSGARRAGWGRHGYGGGRRGGWGG
jgi:hypothetical protein